MRTVISLLFILSTVNVLAQGFTLKLFAFDNIGNSDTLFFGHSDLAHVGIDTFLEEMNIFGVPETELDFRSILRDSTFEICLQTEPSQDPSNLFLYYPENIDSKIDYREIHGPNNISGNFEFILNANSFPVVIRADFEEIQDSGYSGWSTIHLINDNCQTVNVASIDPSTSNFNDTLFIIPDSSTLKFLVNFDIHANTIEIVDPEWKLYPNPVRHNLNIIDIQSNEAVIEVFNSNGNLVDKIETSFQNNLSLDVEKIPRGIYFIRLLDNDNGHFSIRKFVKN